MPETICKYCAGGAHGFCDGLAVGVAGNLLTHCACSMRNHETEEA